jgi:hypothetical protein
MKGLGGMKMKVARSKDKPTAAAMMMARGGKTGVAPGNATGGMNPQKKMPKKA